MKDEAQKFLAKKLLLPILARVGSVVAPFVAAAGFTSGEVETLGAAVIILVGWLIDFVAYKLRGDPAKEWGRN